MASRQPASGYERLALESLPGKGSQEEHSPLLLKLDEGVGSRGKTTHVPPVPARKASGHVTEKPSMVSGR
jgi:hypothetical protein